jgi:hypothetical protein
LSRTGSPSSIRNVIATAPAPFDATVVSTFTAE